jgi:hypothetical protein
MVHAVAAGMVVSVFLFRQAIRKSKERTRNNPRRVSDQTVMLIR